jgi:histone chaperone ASF1
VSFSRLFDLSFLQVLENVLVGPLEVGQSRFVFRAPPPQLSRIPSKDVIGVTVMILWVSYRGADFCKVGYYVNNEWQGDEEEARRGAPDPARISRDVLASRMKISKFAIDWS